jgi:hypothetical protein
MGVLFETTNTVQPTVRPPLGGITFEPIQADDIWTRIRTEVNELVLYHIRREIFEESERIRMEVILSGMRGRIQEMVANTNWDEDSHVSDSDDEPQSEWGSDNEDD